MKKLFVALAAVATLAAAPAMAQDYITGRVGEDSAAVAVGRDFGTLRGEVAYTSLTELNSFNQNARVLSVNGYFEPVSFGAVTPYVTAGVGYGQVRSVGYRNDGLVTNAGAGVDVALSDNWAVNAEWRTFFTGDIRERAQGADRPAFNQDVVSVGVKYKF